MVLLLVAALVIGFFALMASLVHQFTKTAVVQTTNPAQVIPPPPPAAVVVARNWTLGFPSSPVWKTVWAALALVIGAIVVWWLIANTHFPSLPAVPSIPILSLDNIDLIAIALAVAALAAIGGGAWYFTDKPRLATFVYVVTMVLLVYYLYRFGMLNTQRTIPLYFLVAVGAVMVWTYIKGFAWISLELLLVAAFLMLGYSHHHTWDQFTDMLASYEPIGWGSGTQVASTSACSVSGQLPLAAGEVYDLNPQNCDLKLAYPNQCLALRRADWTGDPRWYNVCDIPGRNTTAPNNIRYVYSASPVVMFVQRRPH